MSIKVYTDGSSLGNPGAGGRAVIVIRDGKQIALKGNERNVTNNSMELTAAIEGLLAVIRFVDPHFIFEVNPDLGGVGSGLFEVAPTVKKSQPLKDKIELFTDSQYVRRGVTEWLPTRIKRGRRRSKGGKIIENLFLRQTIAALLEFVPHLERHWVKGHAGDHINELVDELARSEAEKLM